MPGCVTRFGNGNSSIQFRKPASVRVDKVFSEANIGWSLFVLKSPPMGGDGVVFPCRTCDRQISPRAVSCPRLRRASTKRSKTLSLAGRNHHHSGGSRVGDLLDAQNVKGHVIETHEHAGSSKVSAFIAILVLVPMTTRRCLIQPDSNSVAFANGKNPKEPSCRMYQRQ